MNQVTGLRNHSKPSQGVFRNFLNSPRIEEMLHVKMKAIKNYREPLMDEPPSGIAARI